jgi:hypothetical protein
MEKDYNLGFEGIHHIYKEVRFIHRTSLVVFSTPLPHHHVINFRNGIIMSVQQQRWIILDPDIDMNKKIIRYSGEFDICVDKQSQDMFAWWKDGKYIRGQDVRC